jgi:AraC family transcriptional activator of pobA
MGSGQRHGETVSHGALRVVIIGRVASHSAHISLDRLEGGAALEVVLIDGLAVGEGPVREPHRHDYHELLWLSDGCGEHTLDGEPLEVRPGSVTLIGRGQVHVFQRAHGLRGAVVRFTDEVLLGSAAPAGRAVPGWLLGGRGGRTVDVPAGERSHLDGVIRALAAEAERPADARTPELQRQLLSAVLLWFERWYDAARTERRDADDAEVQLHRRFATMLERDFARHHDAAHYADALAVPAAALSKALTQVTGRSTKEHVTDRVMLEAARLLRFTDLTVGQVAHEVGFADPLYFSRAFKRRFGASPAAYRERLRGAP